MTFPVTFPVRGPTNDVAVIIPVEFICSFCKYLAVDIPPAFRLPMNELPFAMYPKEVVNAKLFIVVTSN